MNYSHYNKAILLALASLFLISGSIPAAENRVICYPHAPLPASSEFSIKANGEAIPVYLAGTFRCAPFAFSGTVQVEVAYNGQISSYQINPLSKGIVARQDGNRLLFTLDKPEKLEIQINGATSQVKDGDKLLYLFADAPEVDPPSPNDPSVLYFGPGTHDVPGGHLVVDDSDPHTSLYVAPGALLNASLEIKRNARPFLVHGFGFIQNPTTMEQKKAKAGHSCLILRSCHHVTVSDLTFFNSVWYAIGFSGGSENVVRNIKELNVCVNTDGISFGGSSNNLVEDSLIVGNDNLIVIGGSGKNGPSNNTVRGCTFVKSSYAGNWVFPQGAGPIGPGNLIDDCDVIRVNGEPGLIRVVWGNLTTVDNLVFQNIRVQSLEGYLADPSKNGKDRPNRFLSCEETGKTYNHAPSQEDAARDMQSARSMTFKNIRLPALLPSYIAPGKWTITFDHVYVGGKVATSDADLQLTKGDGVVTKYVY